METKKVITVYYVKNGSKEKLFTTKSKAVIAKETLEFFGFEAEIETRKREIEIN